eukprot:4896544-Prymnesium_polylepis.1
MANNCVVGMIVRVFARARSARAHVAKPGLSANMHMHVALGRVALRVEYKGHLLGVWIRTDV